MLGVSGYVHSFGLSVPNVETLVMVVLLSSCGDVLEVSHVNLVLVILVVRMFCYAIVLFHNENGALCHFRQKLEHGATTRKNSATTRLLWLWSWLIN
jgi:hypothetical protein